MKEETIKKWIYKNPPRISLIFLGFMIIVILVLEDLVGYKNPVIAYIFWISVGVNIGVNWGIGAMKYYHSKNRDNKNENN